MSMRRRGTVLEDHEDDADDVETTGSRAPGDAAGKSSESSRGLAHQFDLDLPRVQFDAALRAYDLCVGMAPTRSMDQSELRIIGSWRIDVRPMERSQDRPVEIATSLGQHVFVPVGIGPVAATFQHAVGHQVLEPGREHVPRDAQVSNHLAVTTDTEERLSKDQHLPAIAEHVGRPLDGVGAARRLVRGGQLVFLSRWMRCETGFLMLLLAA